jgi:hypothetical protein
MLAFADSDITLIQILPWNLPKSLLVILAKNLSCSVVEMKLIEFANVSIGNPSNDVLLQSRGSETITESANASIDSHCLEARMQSRGREATTESTNARS